jgi:hypothetical protein
MPKQKLGPSRGFRPRPKTQERLEFAERVGINCSELINDVLEKHLREQLARELQDRKVKLREALEAPLP